MGRHLGFWQQEAWLNAVGDDAGGHHMPWSVTTYKVEGTDYRVPVYQVAEVHLPAWCLMDKIPEEVQKIKDEHARWLQELMPFTVGYVEPRSARHHLVWVEGGDFLYWSDTGPRILCASRDPVWDAKMTEGNKDKGGLG
jgi:hypothetical protein